MADLKPREKQMIDAFLSGDMDTANSIRAELGAGGTENLVGKITSELADRTVEDIERER